MSDTPDAKYIDCVPKKTSTFLFFEQLCEKLTDFDEFWWVDNLTWNLTDLSTSPVRCSHCTCRKKVIFNSIIHTHFWLFALSQKKTNCNPLALNLKMSPHWMQNIFIWLKFCCVPSNAAGSEENQLWAVIGGTEKNCRLWCVATGMLGKQCHSKCSEWPRSALVHASSLFRHCSVTWYTTLCWNSAHVATSHCCKPQHVRNHTRAPPPQAQY